MYAFYCHINKMAYLANTAKHIVGVGIKDAYRAIQTDAQLANRFEPAVLPRWELNKDFMRLLMSFERMSRLVSRRIYMKFRWLQSYMA